MLNSYDVALILAAKTTHAEGHTGQTSSLGWNDTSKVSRVLVLFCLCVHSHIVCHMQVPCPAILLSLAAYMGAVSSGMSMQRAK